MTRRSGLGKGLSSLIPASDGVDGVDGVETILAEIPIGAIVANPNQPRMHFDEESLVELSASIAEMGILQPILVRPGDKDSHYELIAGERRWRAAQRAGLTTVPAVIRPADDIGLVEQALVENLHRQDLMALEEAAAYQQLLEDFELTHDQLASRICKSRSAITNSHRLLGLPPSVQHLLAEAQLSAGHARALLGTPDRARQEDLARQAVAEGWTVRDVERAIRDASAPAASVIAEENAEGISAANGSIDGAGLTPATRLRPPGLLELEELLAAHLDTRVGVNMTAKKGRVTVDFADLEDLERIYRLMTGA